MIEQMGQSYEFGEFRLDAQKRLLLRRATGEVIPLTPKAFETLAILVAQSGQVVEKEYLMKAIWPDTFVEEGSLTRNISVLRKIFGEGPADHQYIETLPRRGYRFVATVRVANANGAGASAARVEDHMADRQEEEEAAAPPSSYEEVRPAHPERAWPASSSHPLQIGRMGAAVLLTLLVLVLCLLFYTFGSGARTSSVLPPPPPAAPARGMQVTKFTNTGRSIDAAISPDGKFVVYVRDDSGQQSLWVKQVVTASDRQVVAPADVSYQGLAFSHDGNYIFYNLWDKKGVGVIYKLPVLGGLPTRLVVDVMPSLALSPDSTQIAFVRSDAAAKLQELMIARADGSGERRLLTRENGNGWFYQPAWSPDGETIACVVGSIGPQGTSYAHVVTVPARGGAEIDVSPRQWLGIGGLAWRRDGRGLIMTATDQVQSPLQVWSLSYPAGEARKITNDVNGYDSVSLTADSSALVSVQSDLISNIWVVPAGDTGRAKKVTSSKNEGSSLAWAPDGRLLYVSGAETGNPEIWIMDGDGGNKKQLTSDPQADLFPSVAADGQTVVFVSNRSGSFHLWKMKIDGSEPQQLTFGVGEWLPLCSPVENTVYFLTSKSGKGCLWMVPLAGGEPRQLTERYTYLPAISPDGRRLAYTYWNEDAKPERLGREILTLGEADARRQFELPSTAVGSHVAVHLRWSPDGRALTYVDNRDGVSNVWSLPLDGGPPQQLTDFKEDHIFWFDWSRDGKWLACTRGTSTADVVLITNLE